MNVSIKEISLETGGRIRNGETSCRWEGASSQGNDYFDFLSVF